jgi:phage-related protein
MATFLVDNPIYHHGTLVQTPYIEELTSALDPTVRTEMEAGYVASRARFTRTPRQWKLRFDMTKTANRDIIIAFVTARRVGGESFSWVEPVAGATVTVRFQSPPVYVPVDGTNNTRWTITLVLEEV